jgi:hypothetical protein
VQNLLLFIESQALLHALSRTTQNYECGKCHMSEEGQRYFVRLHKSLTERRLINQRQKNGRVCPAADTDLVVSINTATWTLAQQSSYVLVQSNRSTTLQQDQEIIFVSYCTFSDVTYTHNVMFRRLSAIHYNNFPISRTPHFCRLQN